MRKLFLSLILIFVFVSAHAEIATWAIEPDYQQITRYSKNLYAVRNGQEWGLVNSKGKIILPAKYDYITPFTNGYALAGTLDNGNIKLMRIVAQDGSVVSLNTEYYLPKSNQYFSQDKLVVINRNGKYGYIDPSGAAIIRCQFDSALPFKEGLAAVKQGNYFKFINENYDNNPSRNSLIVDFHYGEMTSAGSFSGGYAPVAYNNDYALINRSGQKIKKISETEFRNAYKSNLIVNPDHPGFSQGSPYQYFTEKGKQGIMENGTVIVTPQFDSFNENFTDGDIIATINGRQGVLKLIKGKVTINTKIEGNPSSTIEIDRNENVPNVVVECILPESIDNYKILIREGNDGYSDRTSQFKRKGERLTAVISPHIAKDSEKYSIGVKVEGSSLLLANADQEMKVSYPVKLRMTKPGPSRVRANENNIAVVSATVFNDSGKSVSISGYWSTGSKFTATIPPHSSRSFSTSFTVTYPYTKTVSFTVNGEGTTSDNIYFEPYF